LKRFSSQFAARSIASLNERSRCVSANASARATKSHELMPMFASATTSPRSICVSISSTSAAERRAFSRAMKMSRSSAMVSATMDGEEEQRPHDGAAFVG
jgi:hypothetical protein